MKDLVRGYRRFRRAAWPRERERFEALAEHGQHPRAMVVACCDSRVDPQMIFNAAPGELFVVRNVANLVPPYGPDAAHHGTSAALEFGVRVLKVRDLVVCGHGLCGGITALLEGPPEPAGDFIGSWMALASEALERVRKAAPGAAGEELRRLCERETVRLSLENLLSFPWIDAAVRQGELRLHGCFFAVRDGILEQLDESGAFVPVPLAD
jgi:carbonic anhydrase